MARAARERREKAKVSARRRAEDHKSGFSSKSYKINDSTRLFIVKAEGVKKLDIIPYLVPENAHNPFAEAGDLHFERTYYTHRDIGPDGDMYPCLKKTFGAACPICDHRASMLRDPDADEKEVKSLAPKERQLWNIFDQDDPDKGVQLWDFSFHLFGKQLDARVNNSDEEDGYEFFADPDEGLTLKVGFEEKSFGGNTYYEATTIDFKPRRTALSDELLNKALILDDILIRYDYDELRNIFLQTKHEESPVRRPKDDDDEDAPKTTRSRKEVKEEIEDDDEDFEKEQTPKSRGRTAPKEEVEEDEAPAKSAGRKSTKEKETTEDATETASPSRRRRSERKDPTEGLPKASDFGIKVNMLCDHPEWGQDCSIIKISSDETAVYILDAKDVKHSVTPDTLSNLGFPEEEEAPAPKEEPKAKSKDKAAKGKKAKEPDPVDDDDDPEWDEDFNDD